MTMRFNYRVLIWAAFAHLCFLAGSFAYNDDFEDGIFYYFAYGSNLYDKRIHVKNPTAEFYGAAVLKDYRLDFNLTSPVWKGAVATICNEPGDSVWGALWVMLQSDREHLDRQEWNYKPVDVTVETINGQVLPALVYMQYYETKKLRSWEDLPLKRRPSITYMGVMITGAVQSGLPLQYIKMLCSIPHNNEHAVHSITKQLGKQFIQE